MADTSSSSLFQKCDIKSREKQIEQIQAGTSGGDEKSTKKAAEDKKRSEDEQKRLIVKLYELRAKNSIIHSDKLIS